MKRSLVITDVTRMSEGRVCVAGYDDEEGNCIRPVLPPPGIYEHSLCQNGQPVVFPFAVVEYNLLRSRPQPPHTEDYFYDPASVRFVERLNEKAKQEVLIQSLFQNLTSLFEVPIYSDSGHHVMDGRGPRSLGTIQPQQVIRATYEQSPEGTWKYRLGFIDGAGVSYRLTVTDLTWRYYNDDQRNKGCTPGQISSSLTSILKTRTVYLRVGLARGWVKFPDRCYIQLTGVYTFPDYCEGRTFAEFNLNGCVQSEL